MNIMGPDVKYIYMLYVCGKQPTDVIFWGFTTTREKAEEIMEIHNRVRKNFPMQMNEMKIDEYCLDGVNTEILWGDINDNS